MRRSSALLAVLLVAPLPSSQAQDESQLESTPLIYNLVPGRTLRYVMVNEMASTTSIPGQDAGSRISQSQTSIFRLEVDQVNREVGFATMTQTTESIRVTITDPDGNETTVDSSDPTALEQNPNAASVLALIDLPIEFVMQLDGRVVAVNDEAVRKQVRAKLDEQSKTPEMQLMIDSSLSNAALKSSISMVLGIVPGRETTVGEPWTSQFVLPDPILGRIAFVVESILTDIERESNEKVARIESRLEVVDDAAARAGGNQTRIVESKGAGLTFFNSSRGLVLSSSTETELTLERVSLGADNQPLTIRTTIILRRELRLLPDEK